MIYPYPMFASVHHPETILGEELDAYLERGWFRMGPTIFTTNFLSFKEHLYSAIWLRVVLNNYAGDRTQSKLFKLNSGFKVETKRAAITEEKEILFANYKRSVAFEASASLQHLMYGKSETAPYDTYEINAYDGKKLIATGYFDIGNISGMGITSFYDPEYKKYSLGKFLIYLKINHCKKLGLQYFYPGYFVPGYTFFDYKLTIAKAALQYLKLDTGRWFPIQTFSKQLTPLQVMHEKLALLNDQLTKQMVTSRIMRYEFFDANLIPDLADANLFDYPLFLYLPGSLEDSINQFAIFDVLTAQYHLIRCRGIWKTNSASANDATYASYVLKEEARIYSTTSVEEMSRSIVAERHFITKTSTA